MPEAARGEGAACAWESVVGAHGVTEPVEPQPGTETNREGCGSLERMVRRLCEALNASLEIGRKFGGNFQIHSRMRGETFEVEMGFPSGCAKVRIKGTIEEPEFEPVFQAYHPSGGRDIMCLNRVVGMPDASRIGNGGDKDAGNNTINV